LPCRAVQSIRRIPADPTNLCTFCGCKAYPSRKGTHAHSFISSFKGPDDLQSKGLLDCPTFWECVQANREELELAFRLPKSNIGELAAFTCYAQAFPDHFNALIDTYDTLKSGLPNFLAVAAALHQVGVFIFIGILILLYSFDLREVIVCRYYLKILPGYFKNLYWFGLVRVRPYYR
jgi:hypothetical protein